MDAVALRLTGDVDFGAHRYTARGCCHPLLAEVNPCLQLHGASLHRDLSCPSGIACRTLRSECCWRPYRLEESRSLRSDCYRDCSTCCDDYLGCGLLSGLVRMPMSPQPPNKRLKLTARADYGMNLSSARRSLSAIR